MKRLSTLFLGLCLTLAPRAQTLNTPQQITLQGILANASFNAAAYAADGSLILLLNQHDGIRLLKTNASATTLIAQSQTGSTGDIGLALSLDPSGDIYVTGTTTSTTLTATSGVAFPTHTTSFLAKYDTNLNLIFLTFLGASQTNATSISATASGVNVTGTTSSPTLPVTPNAIQQSPAPNAIQSGFVEAFTPTGALIYATYLTGANGTTTPTAIAADASGNAYITGTTTSPGLPTISALVPNILGTTSGFLAALSPTGSSFLYATYIPGTGLTSIAIDTTTQTLLLTGNINPGQFPLTKATAPLADTPYQTLLRIPLNGQSITSSTLLVPGTQSFVTLGPSSTAWISGSLTTPLFPSPIAPDYPTGDSFLLHLTSSNTIDQTLRFGGLPTRNADYASLTTLVSIPALSTTGTIALTGTLTATTNSIPQTFDFPLVETANSILPNTLADILPTTCTSQCTGTAALLSLLNTTTSAPSLSLSADDLPNITLRNLGSAAATGLTLSATGYTLTSDCATTLQPSNACTIALTGTGPGTLTASSTNTPTATFTLPATTLTPNPIALSTNELDFGIVTSTGPPATQTLTLTNLTTTPQPFTSALDGPTTLYTFAETATTCTAHIIPASSTCTLTLSLTASTTADTPAANFWKIANRDIKLTGFSQVAALNLSSTELDFGTQFTNTPTLNLPRYLYLSNNSTTAITHTLATLPTTSPFTVTDNCPTTLEPHTLCSLTLTYLTPIAPSDDATTLTLDNNQVLVTGQTLPPTGATSSTANPYLTVSTATVNFASPVTVTTVSSTAQTVTLTNTGTVPFPLTTALTGDFLLSNTCPTTLPANASCQLLLSFAPSQPGQREGLLSITSGSGFAPTLISLTGTASAILPANNGTLTLPQTYTNEPTTLFLPIQQSLPALTASSNNQYFNVALIPNTGTPPTTLPQSTFTPTTTSSCTSCYLALQFLSPTSGSQSATLTLTTVPNGNPYLLTLTGTALPIQGLLLTPISQDFGPVNVHSTGAPITFTLANLLTPPSTVTLTSAIVTGDFTVIPGNPSCTGTLPTTASCYLQIAFSPTATGTRTGTLTLTTSSGTLIASLTGFGNPDPGLSLTPNALTFTQSTSTQTITLTNTGTATLTISTPTTSTTNFITNTNCVTLIPTATCTLTVQFIPSTLPVTDTLTLPVITTQNGQSETTSYTIPLTGTYTAEDAGLQILPTQVNFGSTLTSTLGNIRQFTLNNLTAKTLAISLNLPRQFPLAALSTCSTLAPSASCTFSITFLPTTNGSLTGTVSAQGTPTDNSTPVQSLTYMLGYGQGAGTLTLTGLPIPYTPLNFGQLTSGQTAQQTLTLINNGTTPITLHRITSDPPFLTATTCLTTLTPDSTCTVTLTYAPIYELPTTSTNLTPRTDTGTLILESDAANSPTVLEFTGTVAPILSTTPTNASILAAFQLSQSSLTFPTTAIGSASPTQTITLTNTGTTTLHILNTLASTGFTATTTCTTLTPGATCPINIQFTPTPASSNTGTLEIQSDASTSLEFVSLLGTASASPLTLNPTALNFGTVNIPSTSQLPLQITNTTTSPITFTNITTTGDFTYTPNACPANNSTLAANTTCTLTVTFTPTTTGSHTGTLSLSTNATTLPLTIPLTGTGAQSQLQITPAALAFGSISVGSPAPLTLNLLNTGTAPVTNISSAITGTGFTLTSPCSTNTLAPNQGCTATITFTPATTGPQSATLTLTSSDPSSPATIPLTGTGIASTSGSFTLTVVGNTSQTITVTSGSPATYNLNLTPTNSFSGAVALTCTPITAAQYATCSLLSPTLTLNATPQATTATLNTITSEANYTILKLGLLLTPLLFLRRRNLRAATLLSLLCITISACGGGSTPSGGGGKLLYTPAGTYQYKVTATSTSGPTITSTVTLNLIVQ